MKVSQNRSKTLALVAFLEFPQTIFTENSALIFSQREQLWTQNERFQEIKIRKVAFSQQIRSVKKSFQRKQKTGESNSTFQTSGILKGKKRQRKYVERRRNFVICEKMSTFLYSNFFTRTYFGAVQTELRILFSKMIALFKTSKTDDILETRRRMRYQIETTSLSDARLMVFLHDLQKLSLPFLPLLLSTALILSRKLSRKSKIMCDSLSLVIK